MDNRTLKALKESIEKWERNAAVEEPKEVTTGPEDCALCVEFMNDQDDEDACLECPVFIEKGARFCHGSPYTEAYHRWKFWDHSPGSDVLKKEFQEAARKEVEFLKSLLPVEQ